SHPDLAANVWTNPGEIAGNGIDNDADGYVDDVHGWDFSGNDNDPSDTVSVCGGHGTHVSGTIGGSGNNGIGVAGINWTVKIMPLKVMKRLCVLFICSCSGTDADIIEAIGYAADFGVRVSNNSYGGGAASQAMSNAIRASRSLYVAAAGNDGRNINTNPSYPASYSLANIVSVAATDNNDARASFANYGNKAVDLAAPGVSILSTLPGNSYGSYDGTSMATPHVVGAAALLWAQEPAATVNEIKWRLLKGVDPKGLPVLTGGRLNVNNSLNLPVPRVAVSLTPVGSTTVPLGGTVGYTFQATNQTAANQTAKLSVVAQLPDGSEVILDGPVTFTLARVMTRTP
ncbi:MAG: S8 family serine peptidase, partial [Nitrospirae bacterium]|nr:S8 family serine peptidase [Nitrospirota bacterium]